MTGGNHHWDQYRIGTFDGVRFTPEVQGVLDYGYVAAGKTGGAVSNDPEGRHVFFGWNMPWSRQGPGNALSPSLGPYPPPPPLPWRSGAHGRSHRHRRAGAADRWHGERVASDAAETETAPGGEGVVWPDTEPWGSQVLPRDLSLFDDGTLKMGPVPELASLRIAGTHFSSRGRMAASIACLPVNGTQLEVMFTVDLGHTTTTTTTSEDGVASGGGRFPSVTVLASPDGREKTLIGANATHLIVNQHNSSLTPDLTPEQAARVHFFWNNAPVANHTTLYAPLPSNHTHRIHVFLDGMNLEVFADDRVASKPHMITSLPFFKMVPKKLDLRCGLHTSTCRSWVQNTSRFQEKRFHPYFIYDLSFRQLPPTCSQHCGQVPAYHPCCLHGLSVSLLSSSPVACRLPSLG